MTIGPLPDAMNPGFHCVRTHWIRGFMTFMLARRTRMVMLMVPVCPASGSGTCRPAAVHWLTGNYDVPAVRATENAGQCRAFRGRVADPLEWCWFA